MSPFVSTGASASAPERTFCVSEPLTSVPPFGSKVTVYEEQPASRIASATVRTAAVMRKMRRDPASFPFVPAPYASKSRQRREATFSRTYEAAATWSGFT